MGLPRCYAANYLGRYTAQAVGKDSTSGQELCYDSKQSNPLSPLNFLSNVAVVLQPDC
jgi:hypothetical protein